MLRRLEYQPCIPTRGTEVLAGRDWFYEIKHDDYRLIVQRDGQPQWYREGSRWSEPARNKQLMPSDPFIREKFTRECSAVAIAGLSLKADKLWIYGLSPDLNLLPPFMRPYPYHGRE